MSEPKKKSKHGRLTARECELVAATWRAAAMLTSQYDEGSFITEGLTFEKLAESFRKIADTYEE